MNNVSIRRASALVSSWQFRLCASGAFTAAFITYAVLHNGSAVVINSFLSHFWEAIMATGMVFGGSYLFLWAMSYVTSYVVRFEHEGWRRILLSLSVIGAVVGAYIAHEEFIHRFNLNVEDLFQLLVGTALGFIATIMLFACARRFVLWVREGFSQS